LFIYNDAYFNSVLTEEGNIIFLFSDFLIHSEIAN